jgi:hypothetical protein
MKTSIFIVIGFVVVAAATYYFLFPKNYFHIIKLQNGSTVTFSKTAITYESPPDYFSTDGLGQIDSYIPKLLVPSKKYKYLHVFTPDGNRGFGLSQRDGIVQASLNIDTKNEKERDNTIRGFFKQLGIEPSQDYLAANGGVQNATRILEYLLPGGEKEVTVLTKRILQELCGVLPTEALNIKLGEM